MSHLMSIWHYDFIQHAFYAGFLISIITGFIGYFVMVRQLGFATHALGHIGFSGACAALLFGINPMSGQLVINVLSGAVMGSLTSNINKNDLIISLTLSLALGLGALFLSLYHGYAGQASVILFGNLFGVSNTELQLITYTSLPTLALCLLILRPLWFATINPDLAQAKGIRVRYLNFIFFLILAVTISLASQVVGVLLVFVLVIGPPIIALQITHRLASGITMSIVLSLLLVSISIGLSYWSNWPISFWISALIFSSYCILRFIRYQQRIR